VFKTKRQIQDIKDHNEDEDEISANRLMIEQIKKEKVSLFSLMQSQFIFYKFSNFLKAIPLLWQLSFNDKKVNTFLGFVITQSKARSFKST
jgi:hypothetical protein